jgi:NADPH:quinone reductase-like Zn-dependent oxidoreductase
MSRAVIYETFGGPEVLELRDVEEPHAGSGEVRVRVSAAGLNPMDPALAARAEAAAQFGITLPSGFGYDFAKPDALERITDAILAGEVTVPIAATFPIEQIRDAATLQASRHVHGKIVVTL